MSDVLHRDILEAWADEALPRSLLIAGQTGIGKAAFAAALARRIIGVSEDTQIHPDISTVLPNDELKTRPVDIAGIRSLTGSFNLSSTTGKRVGLVIDADRMTMPAANALLKTLEEPPLDAYIILTAAEPWTLPATIRSRIQIRTLPLPTLDEALGFINERAPTISDERATKLLTLADGAPLLALALSETAEVSAVEIAGIAATAAGPGFDRAKALSFAERTGEGGWQTASTLVLRFLYVASMLATGITLPTIDAAEQKTVGEFARKAGAGRLAEAWRLAADLKQSAENQALAKPFLLYRMLLAFDWATKAA